MYIENKILSPCKECIKRSVGCHGKCEKYKNYRVIYQDEKQKIAAYFAEHSDKATNRKPALWNIYYKSKKNRSK